MPGKKTRRKRKLERARAEARSAAAREFPDERATFAHVTAIGGVPVTEDTLAIVIEPLRLESGDVLFVQSPHVAPFYLLTAKGFRDRAEPLRIESVTKTVQTPDGSLRPQNSAGAFDALHGLAIAVILSAAAIEAHSNDMIRRLPEDATVTVERKEGDVDFTREEMERGLNLAEKVTFVGPLLTGGKSIKGTRAWEAYRRVLPLRNELLHMKSEAENDPDDPGPFGLLMRGDGSRAPEDAALVIQAIEPEWMPEHVRPQLGLA